MKTISRYIMTLALLLTAASGAWAEDEVLLTTVTATSQTTYSQSPDGIVTVALSGIDNYIEGFGWVRTAAGTATVTVEATEGYTITRCVFKQNADNYPNRVIEDDLAPFVMTINGGGMFSIPSSFVEASDGQRKVTDMDGLTVIEVYGAAAPAEPDVEVTTNAASEGATFTEASFEMPTYDLTVDYELVRDMSVQMQAQVGDDPDKQPRYRVQWNEDKDTFEPAEMDYQQVLALFSVYDGIEGTTVAPKNYFVSIYAVDDEGNPTGDAMNFTNFTFAPGRYCVTASALLDAPYDGTTAPSNIFVLFEGYQVVIPAGEYVTYYKDEAVRLDEKDKDDIELCTITAVEDGKAVLSDNFDAMTASTPFLLKNTTTEEKTILLIPYNEPNLAVTVADEFIGTLTEKTFTDEEMGAGADFYVCNGKEFIKVRGAGTLAANKAYLKVTGNAPASIPFRRSIDGGEGTTGVDLIDNGKLIIDNDGWYDLNGRRLQGKPSQKGVYIKNGRKVVVK